MSTFCLEMSNKNVPYSSSDRRKNHQRILLTLVSLLSSFDLAMLSTRWGWKGKEAQTISQAEI